MKKIIYALVGVVAVYAVLLVAVNCYDIVPPGMTGAKVTLGKVAPEAVTGFVWKAPFISKVVQTDTRQQTFDFVSKDIKAGNVQPLSLNCSVIYRVVGDNFPKMLSNLDPATYRETILVPHINSALQETIGKNDALLLVTQPEMVREATQYILADELKTDNYIQIVDVLFSKPKFSAEFEEAINKKTTEEQLVAYAKIHTQRVEEEAEQALIMAAVDVKVAKQLNDVIHNPLIIKYEAMKALRKWNGELPSSLMLNGAENAVPVVPFVNNNNKQ